MFRVTITDTTTTLRPSVELHVDTATISDGVLTLTGLAGSWYDETQTGATFAEMIQQEAHFYSRQNDGILTYTLPDWAATITL